MFVYYERIHHVEVGYYIMFAICGAAYLVAWLIMHVPAPKMRMIVLE